MSACLRRLGVGSCLALTTNTMLTIALSHLLGRGLRLETHEAVALARELLAHPCGIPTPENIQLGSDGSASCISTDGMPSVASVADLLVTLLPSGTPNVPAPLRYAIARGLEAVEAPPFASLDEFSSALERFEKGASRDVLRGVLQRGARPSRPIAAPIAGRRRRSRRLRQGVRQWRRGPPSFRRRPTLVVRKPAASSSEPTAADRCRAADVQVLRRRRSSGLACARIAAVGTGGRGGTRRVVCGELRRRVRNHRPACRDKAIRLRARVARGLGRRTCCERFGCEPGGSRTEGRDRARAPDPRGGSRDRPAARGGPRRCPGERAGGPVEHVGEQVRAIQAVRATNANAFSPAFASDGTAIFFHTGRERDARSAIEVATAGSQTGGDLGIMTIADDGSHNYHAQPSPDGRFVAFDSDRDGERGIYVANRDGSQVRRVSGAGYAAVPTWSRNNEWLAYIRAEADKPSVWNLWVQPAAGGTARRVTNYRYGQTWAASWFPDDRRIAYSHEDTLMVMDLQTGEATRYRTPVKGQLVRTPAVSPDGTKIIFQVFRHGAWLLDLADGSMQRVLTDPTAEEFAWSPDGRRVAFHSRRDGQWGIYVLSRS